MEQFSSSSDPRVKWMKLATCRLNLHFSFLALASHSTPTPSCPHTVAMMSHAMPCHAIPLHDVHPLSIHRHVIFILRPSTSDGDRQTPTLCRPALYNHCQPVSLIYMVSSLSHPSIHPSIIICLHPLPHHHPSMICYCIVLCHDIPWGQLPLRCWKLQHGTPWWIVWIWKMLVAWLDAGCCFLLLDGVVQRTKQARASEQRATLQYSTVRTWLVPAWW